MKAIVTFTIYEAVPDREAVLANQGIAAGAALSAAAQTAYEAAITLLRRAARPVGIFTEIGRAEFEIVYQGEGRNEPRTPVGDIIPHAERLALFAATVGQPVSDAIAECFRSGDFPVGAMLDSMASAAADRLGELLEARFMSQLPKERPIAVLRYSPGYCGWHISGQRKLFASLLPNEIGIALRESCLMTPLKSVSGVLIAAPKEMHAFEAAYPFCPRCDTHGCRERIRAMMKSWER